MVCIGRFGIGVPPPTSIHPSVHKNRPKKQGYGRFLWTDRQNPLPPRSVRPFRPVCGRIGGRNGRTDHLPFPSVLPSIIRPISPSKMDGKFYFLMEKWTDGNIRIFPSVHFSAENGRFPSMFATV